MEDGKMFQELARGLPEDERKLLLDRIKKSIQLEDENSERSDSYSPPNDEERKQQIIEDIEKEGPFSRFFLWLLYKMTGKKIDVLFLSKRLKRIKKSIKHIDPELRGLDSRTISGSCGYEFFRLYLASVHLRKVMQKIFLKPDYLAKGLLRILEREIPDVKHSVKDLMPIEAMEEAYLKTGMKSTLREEVLKAVDVYMSTIPKEIFVNLEEGIAPVLYVKEVVLFPFVSFFKLFQFTPAEGVDVISSLFKDASAYISMDYMKRMYEAVTVASRLRNPIVLHDDFVTYLAELAHDDETSEEALDAIEEEKKKIISEFQGLVTAILDFTKIIPLRDMIRYYNQDPYFSVSPDTPRLYLKEFYQSVLRIRFSDEVDFLFPEIQRMYIQKKTEQIFNGKTLANFLNYREYTSIDYKKLGLPFFLHTRSLTLIHNFVLMYFRENIQEMIRILGRGILSQSRTIMERLILHGNSLEAIEEKITAFDYSLSPDAEDGKLFQRLRFSLASDVSQQKIYRSIVLQKDKEVKELLDKSVESLLGLSKVMHDILLSSGKSIQTQLSSHYLIKGKAVTMREIIQERMNTVDDFRKLLDLVLRLERG